MNTTKSANLAAIPIACLLAAGIAVFIVAARVNRPYLAKQAENDAAAAANAPLADPAAEDDAEGEAAAAEDTLAADDGNLSD